MRLILLPFLLILSLVACCIEVDISVPSFPEMARYFKVSEGMIQLTVAYNFLGFCIASLFYGPLCESYGRRGIMVWGNGLLMMGAIACVFAPSIQLLLISRFFQGLGAATSAVVVFAMIADVYQGEKAVKFIGIMNSVLTSVMAIAPVLGAFVNKAVGWRGNYFVVALICIVSWILLALFLPETKKVLEPFDLKKTLKDYKRLFSNSKFISASLVPSLLYSVYLSFIACASFLYMETFGLSIMEYSLHQGLIVISFSVASIFSGKLLSTLKARGCVVWGIAFCILACAAFILVSLIAPLSPYLITSFMTVYATGAAIAYPVIFSYSLDILPDIRGTASSAIMVMRMLLCSVFVGLTSYVYNGQPLSISLVILIGVVLTLIFAVQLLRSEKFSPSKRAL